MDYNAKILGQIANVETSAGRLGRQTLRDRLINNRDEIKAHLDNLNAALEFLDKNPEFENFHNIIGKAGF